jgi:hypothetical protein
LEELEDAGMGNLHHRSEVADEPTGDMRRSVVAFQKKFVVRDVYNRRVA